MGNFMRPHKPFPRACHVPLLDQLLLSLCLDVLPYCIHTDTHADIQTINRGKTSKQTYKQTELAKREFESFTETACPRKSSLKTA